MQVSFNDGLQNGNRRPYLWIAYQGQIHKFSGSNIPGVAVIRSSEFQKNGKWSNTTYQLEIPDGAVACRLLAGMHQRIWPENDRQSAYRRFMSEFSAKVSFLAFDQALEQDFPEARARMLEGESALEALDASESGEAEIVEISTSKCCARNPHDDVRVTAPNGQSYVIAYEVNTGEEIPGVCKVTGRHHQPGYRGGVTTLVLALAPGVEAGLELYHKDGVAYEWALGRAGNGLPGSEIKSAQEGLEDPGSSEPADLSSLGTLFGGVPVQRKK